MTRKLKTEELQWWWVVTVALSLSKVTAHDTATG